MAVATYGGFDTALTIINHTLYNARNYLLTHGAYKKSVVSIELH